MKKLWARLGVVIKDVTEEEFENLKNANNKQAAEMIHNWFQTNRIEIDGETYFPTNDLNEDDEYHEIEEDLEFYL